jgi:replication-associated recombination protein RarA
MPTTRNKNKKITVVFNLDDMADQQDEDEEIESPKRAKKAPKKPTTPTPPPKRRGRARKLEDFTGKLTSLSDFIVLIDTGIHYKNIDVPRLTAIREELVELNMMIGLDEIKKSIVEQLVFYLQNMHEGGEMYLNTVIFGPPGTGKTTVAKILGRIFSKLRIIQNEYEEEDIFECARRDDLVGEYLGSTSVKTAEYLSMCLGGVVFIDEVYSLGNKDGGDSFAKEAIDTINLFLSEHREELMMIVAGYKEEIEQCFFKYNEGLRRRFMWYHTIEPYTSAQLRDIFLSKLHQSGWKWTEEVSPAMVHLIDNHKDSFCDNAGSIENFITMLKIKHSNRVLLLPENEKKIITEEDLKNSIKDYDKKKKKESFMSMYM